MCGHKCPLEFLTDIFIICGHKKMLKFWKTHLASGSALRTATILLAIYCPIASWSALGTVTILLAIHCPIASWSALGTVTILLAIHCLCRLTFLAFPAHGECHIEHVCGLFKEYILHLTVVWYTVEGSSNHYWEPKVRDNYLRVTITPKCSIYSDSTMVYVYYTSEYHQINLITKYSVLEEEEEN